MTRQLQQGVSLLSRRHGRGGPRLGQPRRSTEMTRQLQQHGQILKTPTAHIYVLRNCDEVQPFISEYNNSQEGSELQPFTPSWNQNFIMWFKDKELSDNDNMEIEEVQEQHRPADTSNGGKTVQKRQGRGRNKCKKVAKLKAGEKIKVMFYNNRALSKTFPRQLGRIVHDSNITPVRVKKWTDTSPAAQKHIFDAIKDKFENANPDIEIDVYKAEIMEHGRDLWNNWCGDLNRQFVKPARNMQQAIKNYPKEIKKPDWEWLVKEHFYSKDFIDKSKRNSKNRSNLKILHHSGSKPYRQIIWDNGGKENNPPTLDKLFSLTHMKDGTFVDSKTSTKHAEIEVERLLNPSLSNVELMDKCFESNRCDHVVGYGGGIKARDLRSPIVTKGELIEKLTQSEQEKKELQEDNRALHEENRMITNRVSRMEEEWAELKRNMSASSAHE